MKKYFLVFFGSAALTLGGLWYASQANSTSQEKHTACKQQVNNDSVPIITGRYPLTAVVLHVDYELRIAHLQTEVGTNLKVTEGSMIAFKALRVGDVVAICLSEELYGDVWT